MPVVFACGASHAPGITAWTEAAPKAQANNVLRSYGQLSEMLHAAKPDVLLAITVEHWANFFLNHMPTFCVGRAGHYDGPVEEWLRVPKARIPGDPDFASAILEACMEGGMDPSFSDELMFDHATMVPIHFLTPKSDVPVVPLIINTLTTPMPTAKRCYGLGALLRSFLQTSTKRVAVVATGGLSHWPGEAKAGKINVEFDNRFLELLTSGDRRKLADYTHEEIAREAGSGGHEIRTWITLAGALPDWKATLLAYEPVVPWATGFALVAFSA